MSCVLLMVLKLSKVLIVGSCLPCLVCVATRAAERTRPGEARRGYLCEAAQREQGCR